MSIIVSRQTLARASDFMTRIGRPVSINDIAAEFQVGYNRAAEITRYGTRHNWFAQSYRRGRSVYFPSGDRPETPNDTPAEIAAVPITFATEVEMDFLLKSVDPDNPGEDDTYSEARTMLSDPEAHARGWEARTDVTAGAEITSPVWSTIGTAMESTKRQWEHWEIANEEDDHAAAPYLVGQNPHGNRSLGLHIHIGTSGRSLTRAEKRNIANLSLMEYPLAIGICANSPTHSHLSNRIGVINVRDEPGAYARSMDLFGQPITNPSTGCGNRNHYYEISDSHHGTIEFRAQDSTIPQAALTAAWMLKSLAEKALAMYSSRTSRDVDLAKYRKRRDRAVSIDGPSREDLREYVDELVEKLGDLTLDDLPVSLKEILFLALKKGVMPGHVYNAIATTVEKKFQYFHRLSTRPESYIDAIIGLEFLDDHVKGTFQRWAAEARNAHKLSDLKNLPTDSHGPEALDELEELAAVTPASVETSPLQGMSVAAATTEQLQRAYRELTREGRFQDQTWFADHPQNGWFRLRDLTGLQGAQLEIIMNTGNTSDDRMSFVQMRHSPDRFWVRVVNGNVFDFMVEWRNAIVRN